MSGAHRVLFLKLRHEASDPDREAAASDGDSRGGQHPSDAGYAMRLNREREERSGEDRAGGNERLRRGVKPKARQDGAEHEIGAPVQACNDQADSNGAESRHGTNGTAYRRLRFRRRPVSKRFDRNQQKKRESPTGQQPRMSYAHLQIFHDERDESGSGAEARSSAYQARLRFRERRLRISPRM